MPGAAFIWLAVLGGLLVLWRARRLGPVVTEPLPVVVRSAEVVEGHGRLYSRAGARDRAAAALRAGTMQTAEQPTSGCRAGRRAGRRGRCERAADRAATGRRWGCCRRRSAADDARLVDLAVALDELELAAELPAAEANRAKGTKT